jgi:hypothetical protein
LYRHLAKNNVEHDLHSAKHDRAENTA